MDTKNRPELKYVIHPVTNKPVRIKEVALTLLKKMISVDEFEAERKRRRIKRNKPDKKNKLGKPIKTDNGTVISGLVIKRAVGELFTVVDMSKVEIILTRKEQENMGYLSKSSFESAEAYYRMLLARLWGEHVIFVTSNLKQAEDLVAGRKTLKELTVYNGFSCESDYQRVRKLVIDAGL